METSCSSGTTRDRSGPIRHSWSVVVGIAAALGFAVAISGCPDCKSSSPQARSSAGPGGEQKQAPDESDRAPTGAEDEPTSRDTPSKSEREDASRGSETERSESDAAADPVRILALGNSYTSAVGVEEGKRWPDVLVERLRSDDYEVAEPTFIATGGWTTRQLLSGLERASFDREFDVVAVLIGTNDALSDFPPDRYRREFREVLDRAAALAGGRSSRVVALTLPDYSVTPTGRRIGVEKAERDVETFNDIIREEAEETGAHVVDLAPASEPIEDDPELLADSLHPGAEIHAAWVDRMYDTVRSLVEGRARSDE